MEVRSDQVLLMPPNGEADISELSELVPDPLEDEEAIEAEEITFGLERDLQLALRANITQLEPGLRIVDDGKERVTEAGRIDITAIDSNDNTVVVELKAGSAKPEAVAQILAYMGSIAEESEGPVRGILVASDFHKRVVLASRAISNLTLKKYSFQFRFDTVP